LTQCIMISSLKYENSMWKRLSSSKQSRIRLLTSLVLILLQTTVFSQDTLVLFNKPDNIGFTDSSILISGTYTTSVDQSDSLNIFRYIRLRLEKVFCLPKSVQITSADTNRFKIIYLFDSETDRHEQFTLLNDSLPLTIFDSLTTIIWNDKSADELFKEINTLLQTSNTLILILTHKPARKLKELNKNLSSNSSEKSVLLGILHFSPQEIERDLTHQLGNNILFDIRFEQFLNQPNSLSHYLFRIKQYRFFIYFTCDKIEAKDSICKFDFIMDSPSNQFTNRHWILAVNTNTPTEFPSERSIDSRQLVVKTKNPMVDTLMTFYISKRYPWKAIRIGLDSLKNIKEKELSNKINHRINFLIDSLCNSCYRNNECDSLYDLFTGKYARSSFRYIERSFTKRLIFTKCCEAKNDLMQAYNNYNWMVLNWDGEQKLITWEQVLNKIQEYQFKTYRFDESVELNERLIGEFNDQEATQRAARGLIAKYTYPVSQVLVSFLRGKPNPDLLAHILKDQLLIIPEYIESIYIVKSGNRQPIEIYRKPNSTINNDPQITASNHVQVIDKSLFSIGNIDKSSYLVVHAEITMGTHEGLIFQEIKQRNQPGNSWLKFKKDAFNYGTRFLSQIIAKLITAELADKLPGKIDPYWNALNTNTWIKYMATFNSQGGIIQNRGFDKEKAIYGPDNKTMPVASPVLFIQTIDYKGNKIVEISNPIFEGNLWHSSLKIGFDQ